MAPSLSSAVASLRISTALGHNVAVRSSCSNGGSFSWANTFRHCNTLQAHRQSARTVGRELLRGCEAGSFLTNHKLNGAHKDVSISGAARPGAREVPKGCRAMSTGAIAF